MEKITLVRHPDTNEIIPEIWKEIDDSDGWYEVSNYGRVRSWKTPGKGSRRAKTPKLIKPRIKASGYKRVNLFLNNKHCTLQVHRLVAKAFVPNPKNKNSVNHINGNKLINRYTNLEWCTAEENARHAIKIGLDDTKGENNGASKLSENEVLYIKELYKNEDITQREISEAYGVHEETIGRIIRGSRWKHLNKS